MAAAEAVISVTKYVDTLQHKSYLDDSEAIDVLGRSYVRGQLLTTHVECTTFETTFGSISAIQKQLTAERSSIAQRKIPSPPWKPILETMATAAAAEAPATTEAKGRMLLCWRQRCQEGAWDLRSSSRSKPP